MPATPQIQLNILHCKRPHNERDGRISQRPGVQLCWPCTRLNCFFLILFISCFVVVVRTRVFYFFSLISYWTHDARAPPPSWVGGCCVYSVVRTKCRKAYGVRTSKTVDVIMPQKSGEFRNRKRVKLELCTISISVYFTSYHVSSNGLCGPVVVLFTPRVWKNTCFTVTIRPFVSSPLPFLTCD